MYEPRRVLEKYQKKLSELLGVDVSKVKSLGSDLNAKQVELALVQKIGLTMVEKMMQHKQQRNQTLNARGKAPDVDLMLKEAKAKARQIRLERKKQRPPTESECRSSTQTDSLNCKKYIAQRMEKAGQNSEYDSIFFFAMYKKAQPQPLRQMVKKVKMINAADEVAREAASQLSQNFTLPEKKKNLHEGQIDLVGQYLTHHRKEQLAKDKTLEIKLAQAMILEVKKDLTKQLQWEKRGGLESTKKEIKRPQTSCSYQRGQGLYRERDLDRFESLQEAQRAVTTRQSTQELTTCTFRNQETPIPTESNLITLNRPSTSLKQHNRQRYQKVVEQVSRFGQNRQRKGVSRFERKNDHFYDKQLETVRKSSQELDDMFSIIQQSQNVQKPVVSDSCPISLLQVASSLQGYFTRKSVDSCQENSELSLIFKTKAQLYGGPIPLLKQEPKIKIRRKIVVESKDLT